MHHFARETTIECNINDMILSAKASFQAIAQKIPF